MPGKLPDDDKTVNLIRQSKKKPINFAFGMGKKPEQHCLVLNKKKAGKAIFNDIKKEGDGIVKGAWGTAQLDGKLIKLTLEKEIPGLEKALKLHFKAKGFKFKPSVGGGK